MTSIRKHVLNFNVTENMHKRKYEQEKEKLCYILMSLSICPKGNMNQKKKKCEQVTLHFYVTEYMSKRIHGRYKINCVTF